MKTQRAKLSSNGQVAIPKKVREQTGAKPGTMFLVSVQGKDIVLRPDQQDCGGDTTDKAETGEEDSEAGEERA